MSTSDRLTGAAALAKAALRLERPDRLPRAAAALAMWGPTLAGGVAASSARYPLTTALIDDDGSMTYAELWGATDSVARGMRKRGVTHTSTVGILADNGRLFVQAFIAASKLGAHIVLLNTGFAGPQLADVTVAEKIDVLVHGERFADVARIAGASILIDAAEVRGMSASSWVPMMPTRRQGRTVILTSGTTGRPKGAGRVGSGGAGAIGGMLDRIPCRARDTTVIAAPLFHAWGLAHLGLALTLSATIVVRRRFDPERTLADVAEHRADGLVIVPVMLRRMLDPSIASLADHDATSLRYIASSGSALGSSLTIDALERFGPVLYNTYGSTEVSLATIAGPDELARQPNTAGRVVVGSVVRIVHDDGSDVTPGETGRIFVGNDAPFDGYTDGANKERLDGLVSTGDVGHMKDELLFIDGRDDDMIVSGGENVFPAEVEECIASMLGVVEAAVVGVDDDAYGQRLVAFVVREATARARKVTKQAVREHVRAHLARYKVPRDVTFVAELPRTTTGKVRRRDLGV